MKILKNLVLGLAALIGLLAVGGLLLPAQTHFERSVRIQASPSLVYGYLNGFRQFNQWSPWAALDPNTRYSFSGPDSGVGARQAWVSDDANVGSGSQEIIAVTPNEQIQVKLDFGGTSTENISAWTITPDGEGSRLAWSMTSELGMNPMNRWFGYLLLERFVGADYEKGLAALKPVLESLAAAPAAAAAAAAEAEAPAAEPVAVEPVPAS